MQKLSQIVEDALSILARAQPGRTSPGRVLISNGGLANFAPKFTLDEQMSIPSPHFGMPFVRKVYPYI